VAYDIADATALLGGVEMMATADWDDLAGADVAVVTVGHSIRQGESRVVSHSRSTMRNGRCSPVRRRSSMRLMSRWPRGWPELAASDASTEGA
jgi:hypothetical protein